MKYKIGQEITMIEDFTIETIIGKRKLEVKAGDRAIVDSYSRVKYITGEAKNVMQVMDGVIAEGYDHANIAKVILNRLNVVFGLENFMQDEEINACEMIDEIEDVLFDIL